MGSTFKRSLCALTLLAIIVVAYSLWVGLRPISFSFKVVNLSAEPVDQLLLSGSALEQDVLLANLAPKDSYELEMQLKRVGNVRYSIEQGWNRADDTVVEAAEELTERRRVLTIYPENRFILTSE